MWPLLDVSVAMKTALSAVIRRRTAILFTPALVAMFPHTPLMQYTSDFPDCGVPMVPVRPEPVYTRHPVHTSSTWNHVLGPFQCQNPAGFVYPYPSMGQPPAVTGHVTDPMLIPHVDYWRPTNPENPAPLGTPVLAPEPKKLVAKRYRTMFSEEQSSKLLEKFKEHFYLEGSKRTEFSDQIGLSEKTIAVWFGNRRAAVRKEVDEKLEKCESVDVSGDPETIAELLGVPVGHFICWKWQEEKKEDLRLRSKQCAENKRMIEERKALEKKLKKEREEMKKASKKASKKTSKKTSKKKNRLI